MHWKKSGKSNKAKVKIVVCLELEAKNVQYVEIANASYRDAVRS